MLKLILPVGREAEKPRFSQIYSSSWAEFSSCNTHPPRKGSVLKLYALIGSVKMLQNYKSFSCCNVRVIRDEGNQDTLHTTSLNSNFS